MFSPRRGCRREGNIRRSPHSIKCHNATKADHPGYIHHLEIRHRLDISVREQLHSSQSCRSQHQEPREIAPHSCHRVYFTRLRTRALCVLLPVCEQGHRVYFCPFANKGIVCTFARLRTRASCVLLPDCEQEHRVYFYPFAKRSTVCTFTRLRKGAKRKRAALGRPFLSKRGFSIECWFQRIWSGPQLD